MEILFALEALGEMSATEIADDLAVSREQISRSVSFFVKDGFIDKQRNPERRNATIFLNCSDVPLLKISFPKVTFFVDQW